MLMVGSLLQLTNQGCATEEADIEIRGHGAQQDNKHAEGSPGLITIAT